jgi:formylglycine-generating enzyme required for sulfatase activity
MDDLSNERTLGGAGAKDASSQSSQPRSRRTLAMVIVFLILGGCVTVAVVAARAQSKKRQRRRELTLDCGDGVTMALLLIPAGKFVMGSPHSEAKRDTDEGPRHGANITKPFYIGKYEVTQGQYERIMGKNPSKFKGSDNPVEQVSWNDATEFCRKLSKRTKRSVRLPTEAEWEYACRAGTVTTFHYGDSLGSLQANFDGGKPYGGATSGVYRERTTSVGEFGANAWGLHDMHGNLKEWCADGYNKGYYANSPGQDPGGPPRARSRVLRGGGWSDGADACRSAARGRNKPTGRSSAGGFRVVVETEDGTTGTKIEE